MIVVDASVVVKWYFREPDSDSAMDLLADTGTAMHAPDILLTEVAGAFVRRANDRSVSDSDARRAIDLWTSAWSSGRITGHRLAAPMVEQAASLAIALGHPLPDCLYLALAAELGCDLVTADAKFRLRAHRLYPPIRLLGAISSD